MSIENSNNMSGLISLANNLENISDVAGDEMVKLGRKRIRLNVRINSESAESLSNLHSKILKAYNLAMEGSDNNDLEKSNQAIKMKYSVIRPTINKIRIEQTKGLVIKGENRFNTYSIEVDIIDKLKQIFYHSRKISTDVINYNDIEI